MNIKQSHYVAVMWKNCVTGNPFQLNRGKYGWERNEREKSLKATILPAGIKIAFAEILETNRCRCASTQCKKNKCCVRADCQHCNNQSDIHMDDNETRMKIMKVKMAQKMNNLVDMT